MSLSVLHTIAGLSPNGGGPSRTVPALCDALQELPDVSVRVLTASTGSTLKNLAPQKASLSEVALSHRSSYQFEICKLFEKSRFDLIHDHGQWLAMNRSSAVFSRQHGVPRVVSPRGMLSPWSRQHHKWRKTIAWHLFARRDMHAADLIHATSQLEVDELRQLGLQNPMAMIPNGIDLVEFSKLTNKPKGSHRILFLSRVHRKKGIRELLSVWDRIASLDWELLIAGPDEEGMLKSKNSLPPRCQYLGAIDGRDKIELMQDSDVFVLPSFSENFGVVVAESLMAGTPVITTTGTPWESLKTQGCGWWIQPTELELETALRNAMHTDPIELSQMGQRGRQFVEKTFSWPGIAVQMRQAYLWLLGSSYKPDCIV